MRVAKQCAGSTSHLVAANDARAQLSTKVHTASTLVGHPNNASSKSAASHAESATGNVWMFLHDGCEQVRVPTREVASLLLPTFGEREPRGRQDLTPTMTILAGHL